MKINNYSNEIRKVIIYNGAAETTKEINPYNIKAFYDSKNIFDEPTEGSDDYPKVIINNLIECANNEKHINAKKKNNYIFVVWVRGKYCGAVDGVLYVPANKIKSHEVLTNKKDMRGDGCVNVSYDDKIIFNDEIKIVCKDSEVYFAKGDEPIKNHFESITDLDECIEKETERAEKYPSLFHNAERLLTLYKEKKEQGYKYKVFNYRAIEKEYNYLIFYNCVDHYEKTAEYIKAEKMTEDIKRINKHWDVDDTIKLLKLFKLTKKRK